MKFTEFATVVVCAAGLTLFLIALLIGQNKLCGFESEGTRRCVVVVDRHE
jgi:ligand-binding sensor protein